MGIKGLAISLSGRQLGVEASLEVVVVVDGPVPVSGVCLLDVDKSEVGQAAEALHHTVELSQIGHERGSGAAAKVQHLQRTQCYNGQSSAPATESTL